MRRNYRNGSGNIGLAVISFGIGLVVSFCCPKSVLIAVLAVALIVLGMVFMR